MSAIRQVTRLNDGVTVATAHMPHVRSVSLGLWVAAGSRFEPARLNGICHFIEHMLFKGTRRRSALQISQSVEGIGGYLNAFTGEEHTCYYSRARHDRLQELLDVLMDMFLHSRFDRVDITKERNVIKEELAMYLDQPQHLVQELLNSALWPNHPLGRPVAGTPNSLDRIGRPEMLAFMGSHYRQTDLLVACAGFVNHESLVRAVRDHARRLPPGRRLPCLPAVETQTSASVRLLTKPTEQAQLALGIRTASRHDPRRYALRLLNTLIGENMSSRLFQVVREERGLAYSIYSSLSAFDDTGALVISAGLDTHQVPKALTLILRELARVAKRPPGPAEFRRTRDYVLGQLDLGLENPENQMTWIGEQLMAYNRLLNPATIRRNLAAVTPAQIAAAARDFFRPDRYCLALVSPMSSGKQLEQILARTF